MERNIKISRDAVRPKIEFQTQTIRLLLYLSCMLARVHSSIAVKAVSWKEESQIQPGIAMNTSVSYIF